MKLLIFGAVGLLGVFAMLPTGEHVAGEYVTTLKGRTHGQQVNALKALRSIDGKTIAPGETFSFNDAVGSWSKDRGFQKAPVSFNGQLLPAFGGGVCQTSTTLYNAGLRAGLQVVERHRHHFMPTYVPPGRDAAVAFPDIDLRLRNPYDFPVRIEATREHDELRVKFLASQPIPEKPLVKEIVHDHHPSKPVRINDPDRPSRTLLGKTGFQVSVLRYWKGRVEQISADQYPAMPGVINTPPN
jgi:vancomycin resistance protein VanW